MDEVEGAPTRTQIVLFQLGALALCVALLWWLYEGPAGFGRWFDPVCKLLACDYRRHFHPTIADLAGSGLPGVGWFYPPTLAVLTWPFLGQLDVDTAVGVWTACQALLMGVWCILPPHLAGRSEAPVAVGFTVATALSIPVLQVLKWGQLSTALALLVLAAFLALDRGRSTRGGALLGLAVALKVYPVLLLVWPAVRRDVRALVAAAVTTLVLALLLPMLVLGPAGLMAFYGGVQAGMDEAQGWMRMSPGSHFVPTVVARWWGHEALRERLLQPSALLAVGALPLLAAIRRQRTHDAALWAFAVAGGIFPFLVASSWLHYFAYLPVGWLVLARELPRLAPVHRAGVGTLLGASVLFASLIWHQVLYGADARAYAEAAWLLWSDLLVLAGVAWTLVVTRGADAATPR
ncbi:MAG: DUF2029 domain-containing protein [Alphaproteobacteria bacterium]|nr:DUF2029 domain-containing protein [Alphaproteobacteria bacterium]